MSNVELYKFIKQTGSTRIQTAFMAALAAFEMEYGDLWGRGKESDQLTEDEKSELESFLRLRKLIMDKGNHQLRHWQSYMNGLISVEQKEGNE